MRKTLEVEEGAMPAHVYDPISVWTHPPEDALEAYVMGRVSMADRAHLETHALVCSACCESMTETFRYIEAIKAVLRDAENGGAE